MKPERAMARAHHADQDRPDRVEGAAGGNRTAGELAEADRIDRSFVSRLLRLTPLALRVAEAIPDGLPRKGCCAKGVVELRINDAGKHLRGPHMLPIDKIKGCLHAVNTKSRFPTISIPPNTEEVCYGNSDRNLP
jgi:hypothetical protein